MKKKNHFIKLGFGMPLMCCPHSPKLILRLCVFHCTPFNWMISHQLLWQMKDNNGCCQCFPWAGLPLQGFCQYSSEDCYRMSILKPLGLVVHRMHWQEREWGQCAAHWVCLPWRQISHLLAWAQRREIPGLITLPLNLLREMWATDIKQLFCLET